MSKTCFMLLLSYAAHLSVEAQSTAQLSPPGTNTPAASVAPAVIQRAANERVWGWIVSQTNAAGQTITVTNKAYVELATGLTRFSMESNGWVDAAPGIDLVANGASTRGTSHGVTFTGDAAAATGAVTLTDPDGKQFVSSVYGLAYEDSATGSNVLLGSLQSSQGIVVGDTEVVYSNAFSGSVTADLEYFTKLAGLEQDVVLRTGLPSPDSFPGFKLNNHTTRLQVWTEFLSAPEPREQSWVSGGVQEDWLLDFGAMKMPVGEAFSTQPTQGKPTLVGTVRTSKHWTTINSRTFLIEEIPYEAISNTVRQLPPHAANPTPGADRVKNTASILPLRPRALAPITATGPMKVAKAAPSQPGFVIDYSLVGASATNYVFQNDTTYRVCSTFCG